MNTISSKKTILSIVSKYKHKKKIALVPTMGNLHEGHLALIRHAKKYGEIVIVSIFVNPLQFGPNEDFSSYPRTLENDLEKLASLNVDYVFTPTIEALYHNVAAQTQIHVGEIANQYCGQFRPNFFTGVTTVVTKLFNLIQPDFAIFGEKDFQQLHIIKKMVVDLDMTVEIISLPTIREEDGLALSSRNQYLNSVERKKANLIYQALTEVSNKISRNYTTQEKITQEAIKFLTANQFRIDYLCLCQKDTLNLATPDDKELVVLIAAWLGKTRLIDNILVTR